MSREDRVAASFISRYFELLMTDAKQLSSFYLPKAQFSHEGKTTSIIGSDNIAKALARLYPQASHGRVNIRDMQIKSTEAAAGRFAVSIGGTYFRRGATEGEEFRHVVELQEHQGSNGVFGIYADTRTVQRPQMMSTWAMETPPMFAKAGNESAIPELVQPPASEPAVPIVEPVVAKQPTPKVSPKVSPALKPAAAPVEEVVAPVVEAPVEAPAVVEAEPEAPAAPKAPTSFADMIRARAGKPVQTTPVARVEAKTEEAKAKEEAERLAKEEATKKEKDAASGDRKKSNKGSKKDGEDAKTDKSAKAAAPAAAAAAPATDKRRHGGDKVISHSVVFYDVIVKGLPRTATDKSVEEMISFMGPVKKINVKSQADKKDSSITRTFAFVLFDHEAIVASGGNVAAVIQRVTKEGTQKFTPQRIQIDEVREKFTQEDPRAEKAE